MTHDDLIRQHVRKILDTIETDSAKLASRIKELESEGALIVSGGQTDDNDCWEITNYRTGKVLAEGRELNKYDAKIDELASKFPGGIWDIDRVSADIDIPSKIPTTPGVPESLAAMLYDWIEMPSTSDKDIAAWAGFTVEKVREIRSAEGD